MHLVTKMRVAALYLIASAFVVAMSAPGPHPSISGGAHAVPVSAESFDKESFNNESFKVASNWDGGWGGDGFAGRGGMDGDFRPVISINTAAFQVAAATDHPAAQRHSELTSILATMAPPTRASADVEAELQQIRSTVDDRQKVFDGLASELEVLREELSQMDRREAATEIAARIDATQDEADHIRSALVHSLLGLTAMQAELRNARRYEDLRNELIALEDMMASVRVYIEGESEEASTNSAGGRFVSDFRGLFSEH